jgi:hypothetical protein
LARESSIITILLRELYVIELASIGYNWAYLDIDFGVLIASQLGLARCKILSYRGHGNHYRLARRSMPHRLEPLISVSPSTWINSRIYDDDLPARID